MEWVNFRHLYSFWMVQRCGGFKAAADEIRVSQSTISEQVSFLEDYLQETLFERSTRSLSLTEAGHKLFIIADEIFSKSREINRVIRDKEGGEEPEHFKVGIVGGVSRNLLYKTFQNFFHHSSNIKLEVINGELGEHVRACAKFELDFIITTELPAGKDLINFTSRQIQKSPMVIAGKKKVINKIIKEKSLGVPIDTYLFSYSFSRGDLEEMLNSRFENSFNIVLESDDISLLRFFANSNEGVAILPEIGVFEDLNNGNIEKVTLPFLEEVRFFAIYNKRAIHKDSIERLFKFSKRSR